MKILMVCLGNICRSPLAQGILEDKIKKHGLNWQVDSAGTGGWHSGELPDRRSIQVAKKYSIDLSIQRARKLNGYDLENFDLIFAMDKSNLQDIQKLAQNQEELKKIKLILNESHPNENLIVPDPYYNDNGFEEVYHLLDEACNSIIQNYTSHD
ncbi:MAG: low molecular weight protein-tyrosine-phosphatase [Bacteroidota bacterium]